MRKYFKYALGIIRYIILKPLFKSSGRFFISSNSNIIGYSKIELGNNFYSNKSLRLEVFNGGKLKFGANVCLGQNVHIGVINDVYIGDNVLLGSNVLITDHNHGKYSGDNQDSPFTIPNKRELFSAGKIIIDENVWIGDCVTILPNVKIGSGSIIASNTVVSKDVPKNVIVGGNPLKIIKEYDINQNKWLKPKFSNAVN